MWCGICINLYLVWENNISRHRCLPWWTGLDNHSQTSVVIHNEEVLTHCCGGQGPKSKCSDKGKNSFCPTYIASPTQIVHPKVPRDPSQLTVPPLGETKREVTKKQLPKPCRVYPGDSPLSCPTWENDVDMDECLGKDGNLALTRNLLKTQ